MKLSSKDTEIDNTIRASIYVLKAILIIAVIIGHSYFKYSGLVFWFHIPMFFIISGYLLCIPRIENILSWLKKKLKRYMIPYFSFYLLCFLSEGKISTKQFVKETIRVIYGGRIAGGVYWFITCLLISQIIIVFAENYISSKKHKYILYIAMIILAVIESVFFISKYIPPYPVYFNFPWNADVCLLAVPYIVLGYYGKEEITAYMKFCIRRNGSIGSNNKIKKTVPFVVSIFIVLMLLLLNHSGIYRYSFDMKYSYYTNPVLIIMIPCSIGIILTAISCFTVIKCNKFKNVLIKIGQSTMTIMYIHLMIRDFVMINVFGEQYPVILWVFLCCTAGICFDMIAGKFKWSRLLFNGR
ncbi:MAG: acyltransferase family protein [Clostridia bacterium]|nr:acyltransferase family protein [Clostridia bacterium]